jgi:hypothetical protein
MYGLEKRWIEIVNSRRFIENLPRNGTINLRYKNYVVPPVKHGVIQ